MAQKSNIQTLRNESRSHFIIHNTKFWGSLFFLTRDIIRLFTIKGCLPFNFQVFFENSVLVINSSIFYQTYKITFYKQKLLYKFKNFSAFSVDKTKSLLSVIFKKYMKMYSFNTIVLSIINLNKFIKKNDLFFFYKKLRLYIKSIFDRRFKFFIDFIRITSLFMHGKVSADGYLKIWVRIFKNISKRLHSQFYRFVKLVFTQIFNFAKKDSSVIFKPAGVKLIMNGRLKGKERGSTHLLSIGKVPIQNFSKTIFYAAEHIHTVYGVYGIKAWFFFDNQ